jgi:hypothetical protein
MCFLFLNNLFLQLAKKKKKKLYHCRISIENQIRFDLVLVHGTYLSVVTCKRVLVKNIAILVKESSVVSHYYPTIYV